ncbi:pyruvate/2-oxoglutarate dehydrogenase complex dihydrolipoamide dehydrogenase (E3) component [Spinactinospora alkalitolerans]|uniref:Pyruvate/2-oxoglutarate dehydrogenase complex dihydrolipoamide dehydrogenase (E3) component n=1 Tax=Spinactinospora alkalitolerans TaxID=687207 RepID=A0A852TUU7_9ACTN|nr:FAD-dependent oxidoreductase [Spinactinospora alkalitolerans]NYE47809.1 pyruvate/2-oxoglutarate dehydrogenase complex dihydrolipoamide dehydrogenase (E3) component [Spinactinospora alkalitolerans]
MSHDLLVIGGGAAGLAAVRTAVARGARPLLVTDGPPGGDCTFTGCVPSKTLIEAAERGEGFDSAVRRMRDAVARIAAGEDEAALAAEGVDVLRGRAVFRSPGEVEVEGRVVSAERVVIATGSEPLIPPVPGLDGLDHLTNETVFDLAEPPRSLVVLGGGPIGCELAQAFARFGADVTVVEAGERLLSHEDPEASRVVADRFTAEGVAVRTGAAVARARPVPGGSRLEFDTGASVVADRVLVAVGRSPVTAGLGLDAAGVATDEHGAIRTDPRMATTSRRGSYAAGDVTGRPAFTHAADAMGRIAAANALRRGRGRARFDDAEVPRVTFTSPEVAQVGLTEAEAARTHSDARVAYLPMSEVDRAVTAGRTDGFVKIIAVRRTWTGNLGGGRVLGATIVGERAGELVHEIALALRIGMFTGRLAQTMHAYPTHAIAVQQAAAQFFGGYGGRRARTVRAPGDPDTGTDR